MVSEALAEKVQATSGSYVDGKIWNYNQLNTAENQPFFTEYELTVTQAAPRTGTDIDTLTVYDNYTGAKVTAAPVGNTITLNIPYYFVDENRKSTTTCSWTTPPSRAARLPLPRLLAIDCRPE